jgi:gliding motility-associated-like protein
MKRLLLFALIFLGLLQSANAKHLKGGWIQYEYLGPGATANTSQYRITVRQYLACNSQGGQIDAQIYLGIFDASNDSMVSNLTVDSVTNGSVYLNKVSYNPCIDPQPQVCYLINKYVVVVDLPNNNAGYILAVQRCCRIDGIVNVINSSQVGITYYNTIPGGKYRNCNSPSFVQKDTVLVCYSEPFTFDFSATETATAFAPADSISYVFCDGLAGGNQTNAGTQPNPPSSPPYSSIPYQAPFSGGSPMGPAVTIDPVTGIISGIAPPTTGDYVVAVCALQFRDGVLIGYTKKEIHITVADCSLQAALLKPAYINCDNFTFNFFNESTSTNIASYTWTFGDTLSAPSLDTSHSPTPTHVYSDTGRYNLELVVTATGGCVDSAKAIVKVYPGFHAGFMIQGSCIHTPYKFIDTSYSKYGTINSWSWNLGETTVTNDTFSIPDPTYTYPTVGQKNVELIVSNTNGCSDTATQVLDVRANPVILLPFNDTLICNTDSSLQLFASEQSGTGNATFAWSPADSIINPTTPNPFVHPKDSLTYYVVLTDQGCTATDSVRVNTVHSVYVTAYPKDSIVCLMDTIKLHAVGNDSNKGDYTWTSSTGEKVSPVINPTVQPLVNTTYYVVVNLDDRCFARDTASVTVYPYPTLSVHAKDSVCFGGSIALVDTISNNAQFTWSPTYSLSDSTNQYPIASPDSTTNYVLTVYYTGPDVCPKPVTDTITIVVIPKIILSAGDDTVVVANEPLQLKATGTVDSTNANFVWTNLYGLPNYLNSNTIYNPIATIPLGTDSITYIVTAMLKNPKLCTASDTMFVLVYQTPPEIFVPTAFTPGSGINNVERPVPVGILHLDFFSVYNRYGQLLYTTSQIGQGWDGTFKGVAQPPGAYVYVAQAVDYLGRQLSNKGTFVLIR